MNGEVVAENIIRVFLSGKAEAVLDEMLEERSVEFFADGCVDNVRR